MRPIIRATMMASSCLLLVCIGCSPAPSDPSDSGTSAHKTAPPHEPTANKPDEATQEGAEDVASKKPKGASALIGRWMRTDTPYVIEIRSVRDDGTLDAAYLNPNPINVSKAEVHDKDGSMEVFVELRDTNYPGSTYTLTYDPSNDALVGVYFQAVMRQEFPVAFVRSP